MVIQSPHRLSIKKNLYILPPGGTNTDKQNKGKKILEQHSRTQFFTGFENTSLFFPAM